MNGLLESKLKFYLTLLLGIGLIVFFYFATVSPNISKLNQLKVELENKDLRLSQMKELISNSKDKLVKSRNIEERLKFLNSALPQRISSKRFLTEVEELVRKDNIELKRFLPGKMVKKEGYNQVPIRVSFAGDYQAIIDFISDFKDMKRLINVVSVDIKDREDENLEVNLLLRIYSLQEMEKRDD